MAAKAPRSRRPDARAIRQSLLSYALALPEAYEEHPWGESVAKVNKKVFVFFGQPAPEGRVGFSVKLPHSGGVALGLSFVSPTGYGLGKSGWVTAEIDPTDDVPVEMLKEWIRESYRAIAPKKLAARLDGATGA